MTKHDRQQDFLLKVRVENTNHRKTQPIISLEYVVEGEGFVERTALPLGYTEPLRDNGFSKRSFFIAHNAEYVLSGTEDQQKESTPPPACTFEFTVFHGSSKQRLGSTPLFSLEALRTHQHIHLQAIDPRGRPSGISVVTFQEPVDPDRKAYLLQLRGERLGPKSDLFSAADPFIAVSRDVGGLEVNLDRSEIFQDTPSPIWSPVLLATGMGPPSAPLRFHVWDKDLRRPDYIGDVRLSMLHVREAARHEGVYHRVAIESGPSLTLSRGLTSRHMTHHTAPTLSPPAPAAVAAAAGRGVQLSDIYSGAMPSQLVSSEEEEEEEGEGEALGATEARVVRGTAGTVFAAAALARTLSSLAASASALCSACLASLSAPGIALEYTSLGGVGGLGPEKGAILSS
eukprot:gnl/Dysnectes_brevis/2111_a2449_763.p1 GENE.gnl/Dysnectes_brevis/2111_a2449_763~~gnl/Dysnectes_brevis/2111_a2449_763.p1  ORF type:complete len:400 (-),score=116.69 gnl/Dysnectes_brevis/2111_a2449_763:350-1549(-)